MKKYQNPETKTLVVRAVEMLCVSTGGTGVPFCPGADPFSDESWIG